MSNIKMLLEQQGEEQLSDCCSAKVYAPTDNWAICMDCKEPCDVVGAEGEEEELTYAEARHADSAEKAGDEALDYGGR